MAVPLRPRAPPFAGLPAALTKRRLVGRMKKFGLDWGRGDLPGVTPTWVNPHWCPSGGTGRAPGASNPQKFRFRKPLRPAENSFSSKGLRVVNIFRCCATISTCSDAPPRDSLLKEIRPFEDSPRLKAGDSLEFTMRHCRTSPTMFPVSQTCAWACAQVLPCLHRLSPSVPRLRFSSPRQID